MSKARSPIPPNQVSARILAGLFLVSLSTLMYEILLTRVFSVTMWYHFAFVAISVAMLGMTAGAILVYLFPRVFPAEQTASRMATSAIAFSITIVLSLLTHLSIPFVPGKSVVGLFSIGLTYAAIAVPFVFSGIAVCLALTRFPRHVGLLYGADLAGAALGCLLLVPLIPLTKGPDTAALIAGMAGLGGLCFAREARSLRLTVAAALSVTLFFGIAVISGGAGEGGPPIFRVLWVKGIREEPILYEKWNSFSRVRIYAEATATAKPFGWGLSASYIPVRTVNQLSLDIDAAGATVLTEFHGDPAEVEHLRYDIVNLAHAIRRDAKVFVVGTGGGRDILSALAFGQRSVLGVEINPIIIEAVNKRFGDFTGHLDRIPGVTFVADEARSYLTRSRETFDIIQISLIDTWAATAAGAFVLTENSVYTVEAWETFLSRLTPDGILTVSRWYYSERPDEMYRLAALAAASLEKAGVRDPEEHIYIDWHRRSGRPESGSADPYGVATLLVSKRAFLQAEIDTLDALTRRLGFLPVFSPRFAADSTFARLGRAEDLEHFTSSYPSNIAPPTDDSPFFFHMLRLRNAFRTEGPVRKDPQKTAVIVLTSLLITAVGLTLLFVFVPLALTARKVNLCGAAPLLGYFAAIGGGFMLIELSQMQRLIVFLGHPTYGLSVVLVSLLSASGIGSVLTSRGNTKARRLPGVAPLLLLLAVLAAFGGATPALVRLFDGSTTPIRILVSAAILVPLGLVMGTAFPLGMRLASERAADLTPWLWGVNGATSVCASVASVAIALSFGISASFWTGFAFYCGALACLLVALRSGTAEYPVAV
jgi:hypothetical protein